MKTTNTKRPSIFQMHCALTKYKEDYPDALALIRAGEHYQLFDDDALTAARVLELPVLCSGDTALMGLKCEDLDLYLPRLTRAGIRVAICEHPEEF